MIADVKGENPHTDHHFWNVTRLFLEEKGVSRAGYIFHCDYFFQSSDHTYFRKVSAVILGFVKIEEKKKKKRPVALFWRGKISDLLV